MTGQKPKELDELIQLPEEFWEVWYWFLNLHSTRPIGIGIGSITYTEIINYFRLYDIEPEPWEIDLIKIFDNIAIEYHNKKSAEKTKAVNNNNNKIK